ncbi:MAG: dihydropteroate synthase [Methanomassiliicoccales archaeon]
MPILPLLRGSLPPHTEMYGALIQGEEQIQTGGGKLSAISLKTAEGSGTVILGEEQEIVEWLETSRPDLSAELHKRMENALRPPCKLHIRGKSIPMDRPLIMGVLNVTPDSFSDGGKYVGREAAVQHALSMQDEGADMIDIGGESTRPGATPVTTDEELARVMPVIRSLSGVLKVPLSVDTMKPDVAVAALAEGVSVINDVSGFADRRMRQLAAETGCGLIIMHMQGNPSTMQLSPSYTHVVAEVALFLLHRMELCIADGAEPSAIMLDPGIGFGKTVTHNLLLLRSLYTFRSIGRPVIIGVSRKGFIGKITGEPVDSRIAGSIGASVASWLLGANVLRVHDVRETREAVEMTRAMFGSSHVSVE